MDPTFTEFSGIVGEVKR